MKSFGISIIISLALMQISSTTIESPMKANVHNWNKLEVKQTKSGERRQILDGKTEVFDHFEIHVTTLNPGKAPHGSHTHKDHEPASAGHCNHL